MGADEHCIIADTRGSVMVERIAACGPSLGGSAREGKVAGL